MIDIREVLSNMHSGDKNQLDAIFSPEQRMIVEAPAGCGKTTTMVSKVAYLLSERKIPMNKKILALTFSVNAAYKMKKDVFEKLPQLGLDSINSPQDMNSLMLITNYHGLARRILRRYGYLISNELRRVNDFFAFDEKDRKLEDILIEKGIELTEDEKEFVKAFAEKVMECDENSIESNIVAYNQLIIEKVLPQKCITYNAYLTLATFVLDSNPILRAFYNKLFPFVIVDEFQDTNLLSWRLVKRFITQDTMLLFMGDSLQRIYGFIGAIPKLLEIAERDYNMEKIILTKNYRFSDNLNMLALDKNIRANAANPLSPQINNNATIDLFYLETQEAEVNRLVKYLQDTKEKTAILVQMRNPNIDLLMTELEKNNIEYFYALFSDEDEEYIDYHRKALYEFISILNDSNTGRINKTLLNKVYNRINFIYKASNSKLIEALLKLTKVFFEKVISEFRFLDNDEKIAYIRDTFESRALKQNMDSIDCSLFISTVHGAKGLEWSQVILPDMEPYIFPNYGGLCGKCDYNKGRIQDNYTCKINVNNHSIDDYLEELSVFYVAVTRARKSILFSASTTRYNKDGAQKNSKLSCLLFLPGIVINQIK